MEKIQFDYYRGMEAEQYSFYRVPKILFTAECFKELSCEAKVLYGLLLDRMSLSMKNHWLDEEERVYIIFTVEEIAELLNCGTQKAVKLLKELDSEKGIGLIEKKRLGLGRPNVIYVKNFLVQKNDEENGNIEELQNCENHNSGVVKTTIQEFPKSQFKNDENHNSEDVETIGIETEPLKKEPYLNEEKDILENMEIEMQENEEIGEENFQNCENHNSGTMEITTQELPKSQCNNTDIKNTEFSDTDSIFPSGNGGMMDENDRYQEYFDYFSDQLSMDLLKKDYPYDSEMLDNILELIVETVCTKRPLIRIGAEERPAEIVRSRFMKLNAEHIRYVMDCFKENTTKIRNIRQYMLTTIYNAPTTIDTYYDALVRHDMSHGYLEGGFKKLKMKREEGE